VRRARNRDQDRFQREALLGGPKHAATARIFAARTRKNFLSFEATLMAVNLVTRSSASADPAIDTLLETVRRVVSQNVAPSLTPAGARAVKESSREARARS